MHFSSPIESDGCKKRVRTAFWLPWKPPPFFFCWYYIFQTESDVDDYWCRWLRDEKGLLILIGSCINDGNFPFFRGKSPMKYENENRVKGAPQTRETFVEHFCSNKSTGVISSLREFLNRRCISVGEGDWGGSLSPVVFLYFPKYQEYFKRTSK